MQGCASARLKKTIARPGAELLTLQQYCNFNTSFRPCILSANDMEGIEGGNNYCFSYILNYICTHSFFCITFFRSQIYIMLCRVNDTCNQKRKYELFHCNNTSTFRNDYHHYHIILLFVPSNLRIIVK